ncbi:MAG: histone deacetylase [Gemmatimonadetes bacterium]|nr:histone deacetylase [Gemmatimonadota bacterium]
MRVFYSDHFVIPLPEGHRFPMAKYALLRERVAAAREDELTVPDAATEDELLRVHEPGYVGRVLHGELSREEIRRIGFPWTPQLVERARRSVGGTLGASRAALADGVSANLAGGTHHAFADRGEGYCVFNDVAAAARAMQAEARARRVAVLDLDVHQGNGTAAIFRGDDSVFTLSVHGANNFPFRKEDGDLDIELPDRSGDEVFLAAVERGVRVALRQGPDLAFYLAGADPFEGDRLGRLAVTKEALARRDELVLDLCGAEGVPVAVVMSGGYAREVEDTVDIHFHTIRAASARCGPGRARGRDLAPAASLESA